MIFIKLIGRFDNLSSDDYKNRVVDKCFNLFKGLGVMDDNFCIIFKEDGKFI